MSTNKPPIERFMEKVAVSESGCWEWTAWVDRHGLGREAQRRLRAKKAAA